MDFLRGVSTYVQGVKLPTNLRGKYIADQTAPHKQNTKYRIKVG